MYSTITFIRYIGVIALLTLSCLLPSCDLVDDLMEDETGSEYGETPDEYIEYFDDNDVEYFLDENGNPYTYGEKILFFENGFNETILQQTINEIAQLNEVPPEEVEVVDCGCGREDYVLVRYQEKVDGNLNPLIGSMGDPDGNNDGLSQELSLSVSVVNNYFMSPLPQNLGLSGLLPVNFSEPDINIGISHLTNEERLVIALLDSGFDFDHPALSTYTNFKLWQSPDGDCYELGYDFVNHDGYADDQHGHGTQVGGVILETLQGFNVPISLMPLKISGASGTVTLWNLFCAIGYAVDNGADVVNISAGWYGGGNAIIEQLIIDHPEVIFVCSAGNDRLDTDMLQNSHFPSGYTEHKNVISVAAMDETGLFLANYSNYGKHTIAVGAPGTELTTTNPCDGLLCDEPLLVVQGTSYATPVVTATAAALMHCINTQPANVRWKLYNTGVVNPDLQDKTMSGKSIDINLIPQLLPCRL